jgi:hypothetical protein
MRDLESREGEGLLTPLLGIRTKLIGSGLPSSESLQLRCCTILWLTWTLQAITHQLEINTELRLFSYDRLAGDIGEEDLVFWPAICVEIRNMFHHTSPELPLSSLNRCQYLTLSCLSCLSMSLVAHRTIRRHTSWIYNQDSLPKSLVLSWTLMPRSAWLHASNER